MNREGSDTFTAWIAVNFGALDHDVRIDLPRSATGADLYRLLGSPQSGLGLNRTPPLLTNERTGRALGPDQRLLAAELLTGDRLVAVADKPADPTPPRLTLTFLTGPRRGARFVMPGDVSSMVIGRGTDPGFDHRSVSRDHARLDLTSTGVAVSDAGSTNGTTVNGVTLDPTRAVAVHPGDVVELGDVSFTVLGLPPGRRPVDGAAFHRRGSRLEVQPAPRSADPRPPSAITLPVPPAEPPERRFPMGAAVLPVFMGAVMAGVFSPIFAVFVAMSPLLVVWTHVDDRRSGRRAFAADRAAFLDDLESQRLVVADTADRLSAWHRRRTPTLDQIARWVRGGSPELWARRPRHDDFLTVAVGTTDQPSALSVAAPERGAAELVAAAKAVADLAAVERPAPVVVDLGRHPVVGVIGGAAAVDAARSLVAQLVGLRSPRDLELVVLAPDHQHEWEWMKWLPHTTRSASEGSGLRSIAAADDEAAVLFAELMSGAERRAAAAGDRLGVGRSEAGPHVVVVLQPPVGLSPAAVARFLETAPGVGMSVLFLTADRHGLPSESSMSIEVPDDGGPAEVHDLADGSTVTGVDVWRAGVARTTALARDLAPLVDVTASDADGGIPAVVTLPALHDDPSILFDAEAMARRWQGQHRGLVATLGADGDGPVVVDLQADGPHGLVAGTTGSGKSELLQSMIVDLAARHSPADLNFILIDYKGGSAFRECERLPHTVGFVTDLDDHLAARALISLRAELRHRERVLAELGVRDLAAMRSRFRRTVNADAVLPSLVIVIDEFATLRAEVPDFVDGLVDVAQRGRSMGVHMILATQKPGGVITPQIDANTNIRVALRVAGEADSRDLLGVTDAAAIATDRPGRALLKIGGGATVTPFQSAYVGGRTAAGNEGAHWGLAPFGYGMEPGPFRVVAFDDVARDGDVDVPVDIDGGEPARTIDDPGEGTDLERIVAAAQTVWDASNGGRRLRRPWLPPLPPVVSFESLIVPRPETGAGSGAPHVTIGLADRPETQTQPPYRIDLGQAGHVAVYGSPGSGKTTLLRTAACSLSAAATPVVIYGIDFGSGLRRIEALPTVVDVVAGSELERLQLLLAMLEREVAARLRSGSDTASAADSGAGSDTGNGVAADGDRRPPIVVLIDGFGPFWDTLEAFDFGRQADRFARLLGQAPSAGLHVIMTADQRSAIPFNCLGSIGVRLLQRLASDDEYRALGMTAPPGPESMVPGRTLVVDGPEVQVALADDRDVARLVEDLPAGGKTAHGRPVRALPDVVGIGGIARPASPSSVPIGLDPAHDEVTIDLVDQPTFLIVGAAGSGRSTTLLTLGAQLGAVVADRRAVVPKRTSPLAAGGSPFGTAAIGDRVGAALATVAAEIDERARVGYEGPMVVAVDDADVLFDDKGASVALDTIVLKGRDAGAVVLLAASSFRTSTAYETWIRALRRNGHGLVLQPDGDREEDLFDVRFPRGSALRFPVGRGYLIDRSTVRAVQVAISRSRSGPAPASEGDGRMRG